MIGATTGTWLNYGTTVIFQVLFARAFGTGAEASAFFIALVCAVSLGGVISGTVHVIALPRLSTPDGGVKRGPIRLLVGAGVLAAGIAIVLVVFADQFVSIATGGVDKTADLVRAAGAFLVARVLAGLVATLALVRGHRFAPAAAPAIPSIVAAAYLVAAPTSVDAASTLGFLALGSAFEVAFLTLVSLRKIHLVSGALGDVRTLTVATATQLGLLVALPPLQRIMSSVDSASGAATAHYGLQSLQVAQLLLIGGLAVAAFADWSHLTDRAELGAALARATAFGGLLLVFAAAVGAVAAPSMVRILFQRGSFTESDADAVVSVVRLGVIGFAAEGIALILAQVLVASQRNWLAIRISAVRFAATATLTIIGGVVAGANGVAIAYSIGAVITLVAIWPVAYGLVSLPDDARVMLRKAGIAAVCVGLAALAIALAIPAWPDLVQAALVAAASVGVVVALRLPIRSWRLT